MFLKRLKVVFFIGLIIFIIFTLTACLGNLENLPGDLVDESAKPTHTPGTEPEQDFIAYNGKSFKIDLPKTWIVENNDNSYSVDVVFKAPQPGKNESAFLPTVNVFVNDSEDVDDFNKYIEDVKNNLKLNYIDFTLLEEPSISGDTAVLVYKGSLSGYNVTCKQLIGLENHKIYIITYISDQAVYDTYLTVADKMISTFDLKEN